MTVPTGPDPRGRYWVPDPPGYGTSMHWPHCRDGDCTGCLPPPLPRMCEHMQTRPHMLEEGIHRCPGPREHVEPLSDHSEPYIGPLLPTDRPMWVARVLCPRTPPCGPCVDRAVGGIAEGQARTLTAELVDHARRQAALEPTRRLHAQSKAPLPWLGRWRRRRPKRTLP